jgi:enamine deaminase RidA (YjgF/YER057c/UK114 family)
MAEVKFIQPAGLMRPPTYTPVVAARGGRTIYVSGQVPINEKGELIGKGDLGAQAEQVFRNIDTALKGAGATFADVVKITTFVVGYRPEHRAAMHAVRAKYCSKENPPASTLLGVQALAVADYLIEVEAIAVAD